MVQLILTVLSIALTAATVLAGINYLPSWTMHVAEMEVSVRSAVRKLETAYVSVSRVQSAAALEPLVQADGGLMSLYGATLGFTPPVPTGYAWTYGKGSGSYAGIHYFCMYPLEGSTGPRLEAVVKGMERARNGQSAQQYILASACGAQAPEDISGIAPSLTFYVKPVADVGF